MAEAPLLAQKRVGRVGVIDAVRGLSILLMVVYHLCFDLYQSGYISRSLMYAPVVNFLQVFFASLFILMSGISCRFSRNNLKRGILMFLAGMVVTGVTYFYDQSLMVRFGILHFLGVAAILFSLAGKSLDKLLPSFVAPVVYLIGAVATWTIPNHTYDVEWLWMFGFRAPGFASSDYFPILPNIFIYLFGTWLGTYIVADRFPRWFYNLRLKPLEWIGRKTIWVYLIHQPLCIGIVWVINQMVSI